MRFLLSSASQTIRLVITVICIRDWCAKTDGIAVPSLDCVVRLYCKMIYAVWLGLRVSQSLRHRQSGWCEHCKRHAGSSRFPCHSDKTGDALRKRSRIAGTSKASVDDLLWGDCGGIQVSSLRPTPPDLSCRFAADRDAAICTESSAGINDDFEKSVCADTFVLLPVFRHSTREEGIRRRRQLRRITDPSLRPASRACVVVRKANHDR